MWGRNISSLEHYIKDKASEKTKIKTLEALRLHDRAHLSHPRPMTLCGQRWNSETGAWSGEWSGAAPAPGLLKLLWKHLGAAWITQSIPTSRSDAVISFTQQEKDPQAFNQFRGIDLLNIKGKISFSGLATRMINYLLAATSVTPEGRCAQVPWLCGAVCSSLGANPNSQVQ